MQNKRYVTSFAAMCLAIALLPACKNVVPEVGELSSLLDSPSFSSGKNITYIIATYNSSVTVSGTCDLQTDQLSMSTDNGLTWMSPPIAGGDLDCSDGSFMFILPDASSYLNFTMSSSAGTRESFLLRAQDTSLGDSSNSTVYVQLQSAFKLLAADMNSGGGTAAGSIFKVKNSRFGAPTDNNTIVGSTFKIKVNQEN